MWKSNTLTSTGKNRGYDVLIMDGQLDPHLINHLESKFKDSRVVRVDSDVIDKLIMKDDKKELTLSYEEQGELRNVFEGAGGESGKFWVQFEEMGAEAAPVVITRSEFIRRMKDMSAMSGLSGYYGSMPDIVNLVVNVSHPLVKSVIEQKDQDLAAKIAELKAQAEPLQKDLDGMKKANEKKKEEEIPQADKDKMDELEKSIQELNSQKESALKDFGKDHALTKQLIDLALLANNMLKGEELSKFVKRSVELIKPKSKKK